MECTQYGICSQVAMLTHISVPVLQCSGDWGLGHCVVSHASTSYDRICYPGGLKWTRHHRGAREPAVHYYMGFSLLRLWLSVDSITAHWLIFLTLLTMILIFVSSASTLDIVTEPILLTQSSYPTLNSSSKSHLSTNSFVTILEIFEHDLHRCS